MTAVITRTSKGHFHVSVDGLRIGSAPTRRDAEELAAHYEDLKHRADDDDLDYRTARSETA